MSVYESSITNPKKQLEFYKDLSEQLQQEKDNLQNRIDKALKHIDRIFDEGDEDKVIDNLLRLEKILKGDEE